MRLPCKLLVHEEMHRLLHKHRSACQFCWYGDKIEDVRLLTPTPETQSAECVYFHVQGRCGDLARCMTRDVVRVQAAARRAAVPVDSLAFECAALGGDDTTAPAAPPPEGVYVKVSTSCSESCALANCTLEGTGDGTLETI